MVGRMNGQNVVIRAEKGKVRMMVNETEGAQSKELVYNLNMEQDNNDDQEETKNQAEVYPPGETQGSAHGVDSNPEYCRDLPGDEPQLDVAGSVAEPGDGGDAASPGAKEERRIPSVEQPIGAALGEETVCPEWWVREIGGSSGDVTEKETEHIELSKVSDDQEKTKTPQGNGEEPCGNHYEGPLRLP